jgi:hypothetical protein
VVARQQPGFQGFSLLIQRDTGKLMTISLWETRQDAQAAEARAAPVRSQLTPAIGVTGTPAVEVYEVAGSPDARRRPTWSGLQATPVANSQLSTHDRLSGTHTHYHSTIT